MDTLDVRASLLELRYEIQQLKDAVNAIAAMKTTETQYRQLAMFIEGVERCESHSRHTGQRCMLAPRHRYRHHRYV